MGWDGTGINSHGMGWDGKEKSVPNMDKPWELWWSEIGQDVDKARQASKVLHADILSTTDDSPNRLGIQKCKV